MIEAIQAVLQRRRLVIEQMAVWLVLGVLAYYWLGLPVGRWWQVAVLLVTGLLWLGAAALVIRRAIRLLRRDAPRLPVPQLVAAAVLLVAFGLLLAFALTGWVPAFESLAAQLVSFAVRFGIAYLVLLGCWLTLIALISAGSPLSTQESTAARP